MSQADVEKEPKKVGEKKEHPVGNSTCIRLGSAPVYKAKPCFVLVWQVKATCTCNVAENALYL